MSIIRQEFRTVATSTIMGQALVKAGLVEDKKTLVKESVLTVEPIYGRQNRSKTWSDLEVMVIWIAACAIQNDLLIKDVVLFLEELWFEENYVEEAPAEKEEVVVRKRLGKVFSWARRIASILTMEIIDIERALIEEDVINLIHLARLIQKRDALIKRA